MVDVAVVRWPGQRVERDRLARAGRARLLVLDTDAVPPLADDPLEDWVRDGTAELDVRVRMERLRLRVERSLQQVPEIDADGVIRFGERWASLPPVEARMTAELVARYGGVVSRADLTQAGWPQGGPGRNALDVHVLRLRRRLEPVRLVIRTVRSRGYLLEPAAVAAD